MTTSANKLEKEVRGYLQDFTKEVMVPLMRKIATGVSEEIFHENLSRFQKPQTDITGKDGKFPPVPRPAEVIKGGRKHVVKRRKLGGTVDLALFDSFQKERKERGYNTSQMMDVVLWNYFSIGKPKKPKLSFELSEGSYNKEQPSRA